MLSARWLEKTVYELIAKGSPCPTSNFSAVYYAVFIPEKPKEKIKFAENIFILDAHDVVMLAGKTAQEDE